MANTFLIGTLFLYVIGILGLVRLLRKVNNWPEDKILLTRDAEEINRNFRLITILIGGATVLGIVGIIIR